MAAQHTPGPWIKGNTSDDQIMLIGRNGKGDYICHIQVKQCGGGAIASAMEGARNANARLIAAAPDLFAFAHSIAEPYSEVTDAQLHHASEQPDISLVKINIDPDMARVVIAARAAIARAEGRTS